MPRVAPTSSNVDCISTSPSLKTPSLPDHDSFHVLGEEGKVRLPCWVIITPSFLSSSSGRPRCAPATMDPGSGKRRSESSWPSSRCLSKGKR